MTGITFLPRNAVTFCHIGPCIYEHASLRELALRGIDD